MCHVKARRILLLVTLTCVLFMVSGCSSNESKAEKLAQTAERYVDELNYASAIPAYIEAYDMSPSAEYKTRIADLAVDQNALLSIKEYQDIYLELSAELRSKTEADESFDFEYAARMITKASEALHYLQSIESGNTRIRGHISDIINSDEFKTVMDRLEPLKRIVSDFSDAESLYNDLSLLSFEAEYLAKLYDFPDSFRAYTISRDTAERFNLADRITFEDFCRGSADGGYSASDDKITHPIIEGRDFSDGVAWIRFSSNWACMDKSGVVLFELGPGNEPATDFHGGIAVVDMDKIIDKTGSIVSGNADGQYDSIILSSYQREMKHGTTDNYNGLVFVSKRIDTFELTENRIGIIDAGGDWYLEPISNIEYPNYLGDGMYRVWTTSNGYEINNMIYNSETNSFFEYDGWFRDIYDVFNDGYLICVNGYEGYPDYSVDKNGQKREFSLEGIEYKGIVKDGIHPAEHQGMYSNGLFFAYGKDVNNNHRGKFFDEQGNMALDVSHLNITNVPHFIDGYCLLDLRNDQGSNYFTVIDKNGDMLFEPVKLTPHGNLSCGLYWTKDGEIINYRNVRGEIVFSLPGQVQTAADFSEDILRVESASGTYYADKNGNAIYGGSESRSGTAAGGAAAESYDVDSLNGFLTFLVEKEGHMYDVAPLEFDINNQDINGLLQFVFVKCAWVTNTNDDSIKQYTATISDMTTMMYSLFGIDVSRYTGADIPVSGGVLQYVYDSRSPYYTQTIEWSARGTYDTWAETESVTDNGDGTFTVTANIYSSVNPEEWKDLNRKVIAVVIEYEQSYQLLSFK